MTRIIVLFSLLLCFGCKNGNVASEIILEVDGFITEEANQLNTEGIEISQQGNINAGLEKFYKALEIEPENAAILANIGLALGMRGDESESEQYFIQSLKVSDSTYHLAGINLGLLYYHQDRFEEGIEILNHVIENETDKPTLEGAITNRLFNYIEGGYCDLAKKDLDYVNEHLEEFPNIGTNLALLNNKIKRCN